MVQALRNIGGGLVTALLLLATTFSNGALIFAGPLQSFLSQGVAAALITMAVTSTLAALTSSFPSAVAGPTGNTSALLAAMMASLTPMLSKMPPDQAAALVAASLGGTALLTGSALFLLGWRRLGKLIRFVPYPVVAGFLAATGWLIVSGAGPVAFAWALSHDALAGLTKTRPELLPALFVYIIRLQSERLTFANRQIVALQR
jgi:SulP family sulfate permease